MKLLMKGTFMNAKCNEGLFSPSNSQGFLEMEIVISGGALGAVQYFLFVCDLHCPFNIQPLAVE